MSFYNELQNTAQELKIKSIFMYICVLCIIFFMEALFRVTLVLKGEQTYIYVFIYIGKFAVLPPFLL